MLNSASMARPWASVSPVDALVERATDPMLEEPNFAVNLELAEYVNSKKANTPREAALATVRAINSRNPHTALLAIQLLKTLVKECGYPFHLQIATKEFLNELVRRFPERPPMVLGPVMGKILELIHEWKNTICVTSKYKDDLVHIRDMHRLLSYKGYRFRSFDAVRALQGTDITENLKSPEELEEEDRAAKSAKLQELIRRGTPRDLAQAQELMKELSGAEPEKQPDYASQTKAELEKVQQKAILLNDMLNNIAQDEQVGVDGDAYEQVSGILKAARPKIQKWIGDAGEDNADLMDRLLLMNDLINNVLDRYEACKKGDWAKAAEIDATLNPQNKPPDLISFDAFADDSDLNALSHETTSAPTGTSASAGPASSIGLPLDLFSSPAPQDLFSAQQPQQSSSKPRQDPMAFFNTSQTSQPSFPQLQPQGLHQTSGMFGTFASASGNSVSGSSTPSSNPGFGAGISLPMTPGVAPLQNNAAQSATNTTNTTNTTNSQGKARDPFADLANW
ncbi:ARF-binding protein [Naganishia albida]|nr:ARF-binding protein [Naganishia albida]